MERTEILELMGELKLFGMRAAYDEVMATAIKRQHEPQRIIGELLTAEIAEKQARSIKYQMTIAKLPLAKDLDDFAFAGTPINETLGPRSGHRRLPGRAAQRRAGRRHRHRQDASRHSHRHEPASATAPAAASSPSSTWSTGSRPRARAGRQGRLADYLTRIDFVVLDELGYLPFAQIRRPAALPPDQPALRAHLDHRHDQSRLRRMAERLRRRQDDDRAARSPDPSLRHHRNRQRELALQEPRLTITCQPALAPSAQPRPAPTVRALIVPRRTKGSLLHADLGSRSDAD